MNAINLAIKLLPLMHVLLDAGIIDIQPSLFGTDDYIQLNVETFNKLFPGVGANDQKQFVTYLDGVKIIAVNP